jgi:1-acyl-sn-glycerol-3-phosphate acyltransferase
VKRGLKRARLVGAYYASWIVFGSVSLVLNMGCIVLIALRGGKRYRGAVRRIIRRLFNAWVTWLHASRLLTIEWRHFGEAELPAGTVYIANHPMLIDATILLARLPDAVCIFKPSLMRNPAVGPAAIMAGYVRGDAGLDLIRAAAACVADGQSLLIFPEGTRTAAGSALGHMKPGFALIADRAKAPVRLIVVQTTPGLCTREAPWWRVPAVLPGAITITLDRYWPYVPGRPAAELTRAVETRICEVLGAPKPG